MTPLRLISFESEKKTKNKMMRIEEIFTIGIREMCIAFQTKRSEQGE